MGLCFIIVEQNDCGSEQNYPDLCSISVAGKSTVAMGQYSIKDLEKLARVKAHTIRIWEKRYNLFSPERTDTNIRYYSDDDLKKILNVSLLNAHGLKISKIAQLNEAQINEKVLELEALEGTANQVESLILAMTNLDEDRFEKVISNCILRLGFEDTMVQVILPFLKQVGILWQTNRVRPGQEHFISNLIRQKLIVAIDNHAADLKDDHKTFMLFLPEGELHEMGLLFASYLIRKHGHKVIYLGQSVPFVDLVAINEHRDPDYLLTSTLSYMSQQSMDDYLNKLSTTFAPKKILFLKSPWLPETRKNKNVQVLEEVSDLRDLL